MGIRRSMRTMSGCLPRFPPRLLEASLPFSWHPHHLMTKLSKERMNVLFLEVVLGVFGKSFDKVTDSIGDKCRTNQFIATKLKKPLLGCASHHFQISVREIVSEEKEIVAKVHNFMVKLRTFLLCAELRHHTYLIVKLDNETRWTLVFAMLQRQVALLHFTELDLDELNKLLLPAAMEGRLNVLLKKLDELNDIVLKHQDSSGTLFQVRACLGSVVDVYPALFAYEVQGRRLCTARASNQELSMFSNGGRKIEKNGVCRIDKSTFSRMKELPILLIQLRKVR